LFRIPFLFEDVLPGNHIKNFTPKEPLGAYLGAVITTGPVSSLAEYGRVKTTFTAKAVELYSVGAGLKPAPTNSGISVSGLINVVSFDDRDEKLQYGDYVLIKGELRRPLSLHNPGSFNYSDYLARQGIYSVIVTGKGDFISVLQKHKLNGFIGEIFRFRKKLKALIEKYMPGVEGDILKGVLLGDRSGIENNLKDRFVKTGTVHILVIAGLHVGLIASIFILILNILYLPRYLVHPLASFLLIAYAVLTGLNTPVIRATIMAVAVLMGQAAKRKIDILNCLGLAGMIVLLRNPLSIFDAGFQLSFGTVISIIMFTPKFEELLGLKPGQGRFKKYLLRSVAVSFAAWIGIIPIIAYHFNIISPVCILANIPAVFLLFIIIAAGLVFLNACFLMPFFAPIFASVDQFLIDILIKAVKIFSEIPLGFFWTHRWTALEIVSFYAAGACFGISLYKKDFPKKYIIIAVLVFLNILTWQSIPQNIHNKLQITVLDVGHGDAIFLEFPEGGCALIDTGGKGPDTDMGRDVIGPFLRSKRVSVLDAVFITHGDDDHIGGLESVLKDFKVRKVFTCDNLKFSDKIAGFKDTEITVLNPPENHYSGIEAEKNNNSLVLKIFYKGRSALFCGDIREFTMQRLLAYQTLIKSDCIKIPHHGSRLGPAGASFIKAVSPRIALISAISRDVSQPLEDVLRQAGCVIYKTCSDGAITVTMSEGAVRADVYYK